MTWLTDADQMAPPRERFEKAASLGIGLTSPLWLAFSGAATAGVAWWWMTRWTRPITTPAAARLPASEAIKPARTTPAPADDLTVLVGVGPKLAEALAAKGVTRLAQIAAWTDADVKTLDAALGLKGRATRDAWVAQARRMTARA